MRSKHCLSLIGVIDNECPFSEMVKSRNVSLYFRVFVFVCDILGVGSGETD